MAVSVLERRLVSITPRVASKSILLQHLFYSCIQPVYFINIGNIQDVYCTYVLLNVYIALCIQANMYTTVYSVPTIYSSMGTVYQ